MVNRQISCFTGSHYICVAWPRSSSRVFAAGAEDEVRAGLRGLAKRLGLHVLSSRVDTLRAETGEFAYVGVVSLMESHIALHTWPEDGVVQMDVYSCVKIPHEPVRAWLEVLGAYKVQIHDVSFAHGPKPDPDTCVEKWDDVMGA